MGSMFGVSCGTCGSKSCRCRSKVSPRRYMSGATKPHYCGSPGCTRRGEPESVHTGKPATWQQPKIVIREKGKPNVIYREPDAFRFTVLEVLRKGGFVLARVQYHGCSNYEGQKILLLREKGKEIQALDSLDPHFLQKDENGLIARFVPTQEGWKLGMQVLNSLG